MKLLRVIPSANPELGGTVEGARQIDTALTARGITVDLATLDIDNAGPFLRKYPGKVHPLGPSYFKYGYSPLLGPWLKQNHWKYDAVLVDGLWQYHGYAVWRNISNTDTPYFVSTHGMLDPWFKHNYPLKHIKKWLYWPWSDYRLLRDAKAVLFTTEEEKNVSRESFWLYRCNERVISHGITPPPENAGLDVEFLNKFVHLKNKRIIIFLGRVHEKKGCDLLIEAFAKVAHLDSRLHLVFAGPDQIGWKHKLDAQSKQLSIEKKVSWLGMLQEDVKWGAFYASEVFCLPSHQENFGIAVAEAQACGKPVLITNKVNIWREVLESKSGLVENDTIDGVTKLLEDWCHLSSEKKQQMMSSSFECFRNNFHIDAVVKNLINTIELHSKKS